MAVMLAGARGFAVLTALAVGGCASLYHPEAPPRQSRAIAVDFTSTDLSGWSDMPMGTYQVPNSQVIVSGYQKGGIGVVLLFGVVGVFSENAAGSSEGRARVKSSEDALHITLSSQAHDDLETLIASSPFNGVFSLSPSVTGPVLTVSGDILLQFVNDTDVRPYVILKAKLTTEKGQQTIWRSRYIASMGSRRPLVGDEGWTADNGARLKAATSSELMRALTVMLEDVSSPIPRDEAHKATAMGYFPFIRNRIQVLGYALADDTQFIAFVPKLPNTSLLAGVNIMDKSVTMYRPARADDPLLKSIDEQVK